MLAERTVLVIDDEESIRESLEMFLREKGLTVFTAGTATDGLEALHKHRPLVVILDIRLPDMSGLEVLPLISDAYPEIKVIMITAYHDMETTIQAMRQGAYDYIHKPLDVDELDRAVDMGLHISSESRRDPPLVEEDREWSSGERIVGRTQAMLSIFKTIGLLSRNRATVLIEGETGTGKELIARVIHESSGTKDQPFIAVDCTALVDSLFESELFGHEKGAFTGAVGTKRGRLELASDGTVFLDEVGDLVPRLQAKLLGFLERREFTRVGGTKPIRSHARIIAATNRDVRELAAKGLFRQDLLFRLKVMSISVPPLRERTDDLTYLVQYFLSRINHEFGTRITRLEKGVMEILEAHSWPGNVRELKNTLTKAAIDSRGTVVLRAAIEATLGGSSLQTSEGGSRGTLEELEREHILKTLAMTHGNLSAAARTLGISRPTLRKRLKRYSSHKTEIPAES
jgi:two-component system response regulator AtoC